MAEKFPAEVIRRFVLDTLELSGAPYRIVDKVIMAEVTVEIPAMFFDPPRLEKQTLNMVFTPEDAAGYPGAELVSWGSYRLNWFIEGVKKRGGLTLQTAEADPAAVEKELPGLRAGATAGPVRKVNRPYLAVNYVLSRYADTLREDLVSLGIDMTAGEIHEDFLAILQKAKMTPGIPAGEIARPVLSPAEALNRLHQYLAEKILAWDPSWREKARRCYEEELICLYRYYHEGNADERRVFNERARELYEKYRPRVTVRPVNLGFFYLPEFVYTKKDAAFSYQPLLGRRERVPGLAITPRNDKG